MSARTALGQIDASWTLFLDRDGVLNRKIENGYVLDPSMLEILPGAPRALSLLGKRFGRIVIVTNQRGIARGLMSEDDLARVHSRLFCAIALEGGRIDAVFVCPHDVQEGCNCRKPRPGLALQARTKYEGIEFSKSVLAGDSESDIEMGRLLGMITVRIGRATERGAEDLVFPTLLEFARFVTRGASGPADVG